ncbi:MAG: hypothetical protein RBU30_01200 [Polyangia bacterium]|jgi:hypothetical protein|nr:hypothetical protein [Polyangia bacterium]
MQILGASLANTLQGFLHPGYISAYPRTFEPQMGYPIEYTDPTLQLDLVQALRLQSDALAGSADVGTPMTTAMAGYGSLGAMAMGVLVLFAGFAVLALLRSRERARGGPRRWASPLVPFMPLVAAAGFVLTCGPAPLPTTVPWKDVQLRSYEDPEAATLAIMHGIIADGLINAGQRVSILPNIQNEVALPTTEPTEGMLYALQTYGIDGWGREFRLTLADSIYTVISAGPDGQFSTSDDLRMRVRQAFNDSWDNLRHGFFLRESNGERVLLIHRFPGDHFRYAHRTEAEALTGDKYFDVALTSEMTPAQETKLEAAWTEDASGVGHEPIILQVFGDDSVWD